MTGVPPSGCWQEPESLEQRAVELVRSMAAVKCRNKYPVGVIGAGARAHYTEARRIVEAMNEMIRDPYATRGETILYVLHHLPCALLGHSAESRRWSHCINCRRCGRVLAYGPEITGGWPDETKAAWRAGKKELEAYAEENRRKSIAVDAEGSETPTPHPSNQREPKEA